MIRPLRSRHRTMMVGLAIVVPILFVAGLSVRQATPVMDLPHPGARPTEPATPLGTQAGNLLDGGVVSVRWFAQGSTTRLRIELAEAASLPEVLVYWTLDRTEGLDVLPHGSRLIGSLHGNMTGLLDLPVEVSSDSPGRLVFYILSRASVLGSLELRPPDARIENVAAPGSET